MGSSCRGFFVRLIQPTNSTSPPSKRNAWAFFPSMSTAMRVPLLRKAYSRKRLSSTSGSKRASGKILGSGLKETVVPRPSSFPKDLSLPAGMPRLNFIPHSFPSRRTRTSSQAERAFTTESPTPWRPPDTLYIFRSNLPPEWRVVKTISTPGLP